MKRFTRNALVAAISLAVLGGSAYLLRLDLALALASMASDLRYQAEPTREIPWSSGSDPYGRPAAERPPNVIMILADDLGWNDLTFGGGGVANGSVPTPNIDSIAAGGATFSNGYAANATCAPSRAALMSGRYGTRFGFEFTPTPPGMTSLIALGDGAQRQPRLRGTVLHEDVPEVPYEEMGMPASEITLAELLRAQEYHTVHIGKWHLGRSNGMAPEDQGFDESLLMTSGLYLPEDHPDVVNSKQDFDSIDQFLWASLRFAAQFNGGPVFEPGGYLTDWYTDQAVNVIEANRDRPFFLYLAHWAPHTPLQATREDYEALSHIADHRERVYAAMIRSLDRGVGEVLRALERTGLDENTIVLFTSDNGGAGYVGLPEVNAPFRGWKISFFEGGIHVPFFIRWPARIPAGTAIRAPVHHFDMFATAAAAAAAPLPQDRRIDGVDLLPWATGEAEGQPHRTLFWRSGASRSALVDGFKLITSDPPGRTWLFDLASDPTEQRDLSEERPEKVAELLAAMAAHDSEQAPPAWPSRALMPTNIDKDRSRPDEAGDEYIYWSN